MASTFRLKRKTFGIGSFLGLTNLANAGRAASIAATAKQGSNLAKGMSSIAQKQAVIGTAKLGAIGATAYGGKQVFDKMTGEG